MIISCKICSVTGEAFINTYDNTPNPLFLRTEDDNGFICITCFDKKEELKELTYYFKVKNDNKKC